MKLGRFCCRPDKTVHHREFLAQPFSAGGFTYASDGHICVRIPEVAGSIAYPAPPENFDIKKLFDVFPDKAKWHSMLRHSLPAPVTIACPTCKGRGRTHECPRCQCPCFHCDGATRIYDDPSASGVEVLGKVIAVRYFRLMAELRNLRVAPMENPTHQDPLPFSFQDGYLDCQGLLMPLNYRPSQVFKTIWTED